MDAAAAQVAVVVDATTPGRPLGVISDREVAALVRGEARLME
jgi:hypothetical protein